jgi:hypothetical protein
MILVLSDFWNLSASLILVLCAFKNLSHQPYPIIGSKIDSWLPSTFVRRRFWQSSPAGRTVWFSRRVWLFDCGSYLYRKEITTLSAPECMPVGSSMCYALKASDFKSSGRQRYINQFKQIQRTLTCSVFPHCSEEHVELCCVVSMQNPAAPKNI